MVLAVRALHRPLLPRCQTLVRRGGILNHHSIAYSFSSISAKNYQNLFMCIEVILCYISVVFLRHSVYSVKIYYVFWGALGPGAHTGNLCLAATT